jgi:hypothetical protein
MLGISWFASGWSPFSLAMTALAGLMPGYYWVMWTRSRFVRLIDALPGPKPLPLLGNILQLPNFSLYGNKNDCCGFCIKNISNSKNELILLRGEVRAYLSDLDQLLSGCFHGSL